MTSVARARSAQPPLDFSYSDVQPISASFAGPSSSVSSLAPISYAVGAPSLDPSPLAPPGPDDLVGLGDTPDDDGIRAAASGPPPFLSGYTASTPSFDVAEFGLDLSAGASTDPDLSIGFTGELKFPELPASLLDQAPEYEFSAHTRANVFDAAQDYVGDEEANRLFGLDSYDPQVAFSTDADESLFLPPSRTIDADGSAVHVAEYGFNDVPDGNEAQLAQSSRSLIDWGHSPSNRSTPSLLPGGPIASTSTPGIPTPVSGLSAQTPSRFLEAEPASKRRRQSYTSTALGSSDETTPPGYSSTRPFAQSPSQAFIGGNDGYNGPSPASAVTVPSHSLLPPPAPATVWPPNPNVPLQPQQQSPQQSSSAMLNRRGVQSWQDQRYDPGPSRQSEWGNGPQILYNGPPRSSNQSGNSTGPLNSSGSGYYGPIGSVSAGYGAERYVNNGALPMGMPAGGMGGVNMSGQRLSLSAMPPRSGPSYQDAYPAQSLQDKTEMIEAIGQAVDATLEADGIARCPYPNCTKTFAKNRTYNLKAHLRAHSQLKPYACSQCPRAFSRKHDLERHARVHSGDRPYVCEVCQKGFPRSDALRRHWRVEKECGDKAALLDSQQQQREREQEAQEGPHGPKAPGGGDESRNGGLGGVDPRRGSTSASGGETSSEHSPAYLEQQAAQMHHQQRAHDGAGTGGYPTTYSTGQFYPSNFMPPHRQHAHQGKSPLHQQPHAQQQQQQQQHQNWQAHPAPSHYHQSRPMPDVNGVIKYDQYDVNSSAPTQHAGMNGAPPSSNGSPPDEGGGFKKRGRED